LSQLASIPLLLRAVPVFKLIHVLNAVTSALHRTSISSHLPWPVHSWQPNSIAAGLLQQRNAGAEWVLRMWLDYYSKQLEGLRKDDASLQEQLRALSDAPEKDKAGKGSSKDSPKEREEHLTRKANLVRRLHAMRVAALNELLV
jgi:hypothetical protein